MVGKWLVSPRTYPLWTNRFWSNRLYLRTLEWPVEVGIFIHYAYASALMLMAIKEFVAWSVSFFTSCFPFFRFAGESPLQGVAESPMLTDAYSSQCEGVIPSYTFAKIKISKVYTQPNPSLAFVWKKGVKKKQIPLCLSWFSDILHFKTPKSIVHWSIPVDDEIPIFHH